MHHYPGFKGHAIALQAGGRGLGEQKEKENAAPIVIMQWTGWANGEGTRCKVFVFQPVRRRGGVRRSCPTPGPGPDTGQLLKGTHTQEWTRRVYVRK